MNIKLHLNLYLIHTFKFFTYLIKGFCGEIYFVVFIINNNDFSFVDYKINLNFLLFCKNDKKNICYLYLIYKVLLIIRRTLN